MTPKHRLYLTLTERLALLQHQDENLLDTDPESWHLARQIDDWLRLYMDDDRVSRAQYARNCERLLALYVTPQHQTVGATS
jgi:hypothetical protein